MIYKSTNDSFIFSFADRNNLRSTKVGCYTNNSEYAIGCYSDRGPAFGDGYDLCCCNDGSWYGKPNNSYPKIDDIQNGTWFKVDDYEVFQIVKM